MQLPDMWLTELTAPFQRYWQSCGTGGDGCAGTGQAWLFATSSEHLEFQVGQAAVSASCVCFLLVHPWSTRELLGR